MAAGDVTVIAHLLTVQVRRPRAVVVITQNPLRNGISVPRPPRRSIPRRGRSGNV